MHNHLFCDSVCPRKFSDSTNFQKIRISLILEKIECIVNLISVGYIDMWGNYGKI